MGRWRGRRDQSCFRCSPDTLPVPLILSSLPYHSAPSPPIRNCENTRSNDGSDLLGSGVFSQLLVLHEQILPVSEGLPDLVPFVDSLDFEGGDVLYGRDGQGAVLQHELDHFMALAEQGVVQGSVPEIGRFFKTLECNSGLSHPGNILVCSKNVILRVKYSSEKAPFCTPGLLLFCFEGRKTSVRLGQGPRAGAPAKS